MTFQKRQKELKRQEKQRAKVERREQKKFAKRAAKEAQGTPTTTSSATCGCELLRESRFYR